MRIRQTTKLSTMTFRPESAFLSCFDQAIEITAKTLMEAGMSEDDVWLALTHSVETLKMGIDSISSNQFSSNFKLKSTEDSENSENRRLAV